MTDLIIQITDLVEMKVAGNSYLSEEVRDLAINQLTSGGRVKLEYSYSNASPDTVKIITTVEEFEDYWPQRDNARDPESATT